MLRALNDCNIDQGQGPLRLPRTGPLLPTIHIKPVPRRPRKSSSFKILKDESIYPPEEVQTDLEWLEEVGDTVFLYEEMRTAIKGQLVCETTLLEFLQIIGAAVIAGDIQYPGHLKPGYFFS